MITEIDTDVCYCPAYGGGSHALSDLCDPSCEHWFTLLIDGEYWRVERKVLAESCPWCTIEQLQERCADLAMQVGGWQEANESGWINSLRKRESHDELERLRSMMRECSEYLKEGETPVQCIRRNRADVERALQLLIDRSQARK